jgi:hypothetical protein
MRNTENKLGEQIDMQPTWLFMLHSMMLWGSQSKILIGKINYGYIFGSGIMEWSWFLLARVISPNFTAGTEKIPHEHDSECSLCWPRFVPGTSRKQATRFTHGDKCITIVRDIHTVCVTIWTTIRGATQNFWEFEYTAQTVSGTNLRR